MTYLSFDISVTFVFSLKEFLVSVQAQHDFSSKPYLVPIFVSSSGSSLFLLEASLAPNFHLHLCCFYVSRNCGRWIEKLPRY